MFLKKSLEDFQLSYQTAVLEKQREYLSRSHGGSIAFLTPVCVSEFYLKKLLLFKAGTHENTFSWCYILS